MECGIVTLGKLFLSEVLLPWVRSVWVNREAVRELRARVETLKEQCSEWERKFHASRKELGEVKVFATAGLLPYTICYPSGTPFFVALVMLCMIHRSTLVDLAAVLGSQLLPMTSDLKKYVRQGLRLGASVCQSARRQIRLVSSHLMQLAVRIHRRIHDWKWKSVAGAQSLKTAP